MPKTIRTAIKSLKPKAPLIQGPTSLVALLGACGCLHLSGLYVLLFSLFSTLGLEVKNALMFLGETAAASHLLKIKGANSTMVFDADGFKNSLSIFAFHQKAKQPILPFDLEKRNKPRAGIAPGSSAP